MKLKFKSAWIGLFLIAVMLFSTFAYAVIQAFYPRDQSPQSNIINYRLDPNTKNALIQSGATVIAFEYSPNCENCVYQKAELESYANQYKTQILLQEISLQNLNESTITIDSVYGTETLVNANSTGIFSAFCKLMASPPVTCALSAT